MIEKKKSTAPVSSVGADGEQPKTKNYTEIIANGNVKNNLQATVFRNVINLRKRTMPDIITPLYRVKIFGIALDMKSS